jgi:hypothetical protein
VGAPKAVALREALTTDPDTTTEPTVDTFTPDPIGTVANTTEANETARTRPTTPPRPTPLRPPPTSPRSRRLPPSDTRTRRSPPLTLLRPPRRSRPPAGRWRGRVLLLALPAFVAIWSGWVSLGELAGFGIVHPLPGITDAWTINTAITLPIGVETYAAYALWVWLSGRAPHTAHEFAKWSAIGSLAFGAAGQVAYHLMAAAGMTVAPWQITAAVACLPVAVLGMGAALAHLLHAARSDA